MKKMIDFYDSKKKAIQIIMIGILIMLFLMPIITAKRVRLGNEYASKEEVALYIKTYHELPPNYITNYGRQTSLSHGGDLTNKIVGGDTHWNTGTLADFGIKITAPLKECDIKGEQYMLTSTTANRGELRLVYTTNVKNVRVFYTEDHYDSYEEITTFQLQLTRNIFWIIFAVYLGGCITLVIVVDHYRKKMATKKAEMLK
jgi:hypothetical protein